MMRILCGILIAGATVWPVWAAQEIKMPVNLDRLAERASESVDVTLDASMLQLASQFLSKDDPDQAQVKKIASKLKGVYVKSFEFDKAGQYSPSDLASVRDQLKPPVWTRIVDVKSSRGENSEIYVMKKGDQIGGLVVLAAEPKELTVVNIDGPIDPNELSQLEGHLGIPKVDKPKKRANSPGKHSESEE